MGHRRDRPATVQAPRESERAAPGRPPTDRDDFAAFYRAEMPRLVALARGLCGAASADDVAQEAMLAAYRHWSRVRDLERPDAYVRRVASLGHCYCAGWASPSFAWSPDGRSLLVYSLPNSARPGAHVLSIDGRVEGTPLGGESPVAWGS